MARDQFYGHNHHHHQEQQHQMINQIQGFDDTNQNPTDHHHYSHQIFGSNSNMGMMIDFSKQQQIRMTSGPDHHHHDQTSGGTDQNHLLEDSSSTMRLCNVNNDFPSEVNDERPPQRPSQGLSLSLSSSNPTSISLQPFELRTQQQQQGYSGKSTHHQNLQHSQMMMMMMNSHHQNNNHQHHNHHHQFQIGSSKYLSPAQELLSEFCSLGVKESDEEVMMMKHKKKQKGKQQEEWDTSHNNNDQHDQSATTSSKKHVPPLHSLEFMELQKRKAKLLSLLEELKRRYGHYREQMRVAAASFEAAVGVGAAEVYTALASRAMSRHFRCLKDGLVGQVQATSQALGEREEDNRAVSIAARGETPRLRLLDQALRQQKSYRQMTLVDAHPWRPQRGLPERAVTTLRAWLFEHFLHPYPSDVDKHILARQTGLSRSQVSNWFINARVRLWKPMIEEMYCEETRGEQMDITTNPMMIDTKPDPNQIIGVEPESLSSIVTNPTSKTGLKALNSNQHATTSYGSNFDFSLYGNQAVTYAGEGGPRGDVSLTLGLQQRNDGNGGVSLALSPVTAQGGQLYYGSRDHIDQEGPVQYSASMLDDDQVQNLPYRNLMGAQLLHDIV
ncbi:PREDICTED: homeobox protein BEL1 homolog isoform X1 [Camelina sativa]|uniref:Homeobox protein BEL1 homolog isoform X1 n=1 Tax=Camelina sativa TaxID=90675 RepID=A0ABM1QPY3_CAMSA|nr:PREDICTED: homeobox protein BEL1 homolog isoform X2 [Camelina sativa]XP_019088821.1 PREDICTED: homeobox protein BEL1 homolog isoform X1 [Camelina sativa]